MSDDGSTKDDVKVPDGEVGDKIQKMFREEEKDCSMSPWSMVLFRKEANKFQMSSC